MKTTNRQLETTDYTEYTDENTKSCRDTVLRVPLLESQTARRKQFMREYRRLYKEMKQFVDEVLRQNSPQKRKGRKEKFRLDNRNDWIKREKSAKCMDDRIKNHGMQFVGAAGDAVPPPPNPPASGGECPPLEGEKGGGKTHELKCWPKYFGSIVHGEIMPLSNNRTVAEYIIEKLKQKPRQHIMDLVEGFAETRQVGKINKSLRGYASAISRAVTMLEKSGKIRIINDWELEVKK